MSENAGTTSMGVRKGLSIADYGCLAEKRCSEPALGEVVGIVFVIVFAMGIGGCSTNESHAPSPEPTALVMTGTDGSVQIEFDRIKLKVLAEDGSGQPVAGIGVAALDVGNILVMAYDPEGRYDADIVQVQLRDDIEGGLTDRGPRHQAQVLAVISVALRLAAAVEAVKINLEHLNLTAKTLDRIWPGYEEHCGTQSELAALVHKKIEVPLTLFAFQPLPREHWEGLSDVILRLPISEKARSVLSKDILKSVAEQVIHTLLDQTIARLQARGGVGKDFIRADSQLQLRINYWPFFFHMTGNTTVARAMKVPIIRVGFGSCGEIPDLDGDGFNRTLDCPDSDPANHPLAMERCDGIDNDCDGTVDEGIPCTIETPFATRPGQGEPIALPPEAVTGPVAEQRELVVGSATPAVLSSLPPQVDQKQGSNATTNMDAGSSKADTDSASGSPETTAKTGSEMQGKTESSLSVQPSLPAVPPPLSPVPKYYRRWDVREGDTWFSCALKKEDPFGDCPPMMAELVESWVSKEISTRDQCVPGDFRAWNAYTKKCIEYRNYTCVWLSPSPAASYCQHPTTGMKSRTVPEIRFDGKFGIEITVPGPSGDAEDRRYDVGLFFGENPRPAFIQGQQVRVRAEFYLPKLSTTGFRVGADCTPSEYPHPGAGILEAHTFQPDLNRGSWESTALFVYPTVGKLDAVTSLQPNCAGWVQCLGSGLWPTDAGPADGGGQGGVCYLARFEVSGAADTCGAEDTQAQLVVPDCEGCQLGHSFTYPQQWIAAASPSTNGQSDAVWNFGGIMVRSLCRKTIEFNVSVPKKPWLIDAVGIPPGQAAIVTRPDATWRIVRRGEVLATKTITCPEWVVPNISGSGFHGKFILEDGSVSAAGNGFVACGSLAP